MSDQDERQNPPEPETMIEKPPQFPEQEGDDDIQHGRNAQRPEVNPGTSVQPGHRDREQTRGS